jgi:hypothetical protein
MDGEDQGGGRRYPWGRLVLVGVLAVVGGHYFGRLALSEVAPGRSRETAWVDVNAAQAPAGDVLGRIAMQSGINMVVPHVPELERSITLELREVPWDDATAAVADATGMLVERSMSGGRVLRFRTCHDAAKLRGFDPAAWRSLHPTCDAPERWVFLALALGALAGWLLAAGLCWAAGRRQRRRAARA